MKKITCKKPCNIGGTYFVIGDAVPEGLIAPGREAALIKYGLISVEDFPESPSIPASTDNSGSGKNDDEQKEAEQPTSIGTRSEKKTGKKVKE